jgi:hypothetical protein
MFYIVTFIVSLSFLETNILSTFAQTDNIAFDNIKASATSEYLKIAVFIDMFHRIWFHGLQGYVRCFKYIYRTSGGHCNWWSDKLVDLYYILVKIAYINNLVLIFGFTNMCHLLVLVRMNV